MNRKIAMVYKKSRLEDQGNDFAYWQTRSYEERIAALEEIRREYHEWENSTQQDADNVQSGFQRVYRIVKR